MKLTFKNFAMAIVTGAIALSGATSASADDGKFAMIRKAKIISSEFSPLVLLLVAVTSNSQADEPFIQADVYNVLYEAQVHCDDNLGQSRSEFIVEMFERYRGNRVSIELLRKLMGHNVQVAQQLIADKTRERELYVSEILDEPKESSEEGVDSAAASKDRHEIIRQIDDFLTEKWEYVKVRECVLTVL